MDLKKALDLAFNAAAPGDMRHYESERLKEAIIAKLSEEFHVLPRSRTVYIDATGTGGPVETPTDG